MKITFITPAADIRRSFIYRLGIHLYGFPSPITGPLILGDILKKAGHSVEVHEELYKKLNLNRILQADIIGISTMTSSAPRAYQLAGFFRAHGRKVIIGGMHTSVLPGEALKYCDQVIVGEAENVIKDVIEGRIKDKIVYSSYPKNLDTVPFPDYSLLKTPYKTANVLSTRGCPFSCNFCTTTRMFYPYRERSIDNIIKELEIYKESGFKYINFQDDNFTANKKRAKSILIRMIKDNLIFNNTFFFGRTDIAKDVELLELLHEAHFRTVLIGIESINQESLDYIDKKQNIMDIKRCVEKLYKYKIKIIASVVLGLDFDDKGNIKNTINFCKNINAYKLQPPPLTPYPGTPVYKQFEKEKRLFIRDWQYFDMMHVTFKPKRISAFDLQKEFIKSLNRFYSLISSIKILFIFGPKAAFSRISLSLIVSIGSIFSRIKENKYYTSLKKIV